MPRGHVTVPEAGTPLRRGPVQFLGWCLLPGTTVSRVEASLNGGPPQRARIAMEQLELPDRTDHPDAPLSTFELQLDLGRLAADVSEVTIAAVAQAVDGRRFELDAVSYPIAPGPEPFTDLDGRAATLRGRATVAATGRARGDGSELRLLAFTHQLVLGGACLWLLEVVSRLVSSPGVSCRLVSLADGPLRPEFERVGVPVHVTDGFPVSSVERYEGNLAELCAWASVHEIDAVLANTAGAFAGADVASRLGLPVVWAIHESFTVPMFWFVAYAPGVLHPWARAQAERALREAGAVVFAAEATRRLYLSHADPRRLVTLPYGIELEAIDVARAERNPALERERLGIAADATVVLCLGSIEPRKSQAMLVQAFARIAEHYPRAELLLVGEADTGYTEAYRRSLRRHLERSGLASRVRIEPTDADPHGWHLVADVLVSASDVESLPRVIVEAMAFETPVVATRCFGVPELIEDGVTGYLCDMRDVGDLAQALDRVLGAEREELRRITTAAAERVRARHDPSTSAAELMRLLRGLHEDPTALPGEILAPPPTPVS